VLAGLVALLLVGAAVAGTTYVRGQYYVGVDGEEVAVFRGVRGSVGAFELHSVSQRPGIRVDDLPAFEQRRVRQGIEAQSPSDAEQIVDRLRATVAPDDVPSTVPSPSPSPSPSTPAAPAASPTPSPTTAGATG
jgi:protein phosphatase